jgi:predicted RNA-binding protein with PIN domain
MRPLYLLDGYNFLHAVVLRGRERAHFWSTENQRRVCDWAVRFTGGQVWVVFDAGEDNVERLSASEQRMPCLYARDADARIVELCREHAAQRRVIVVSADRSLCDRARNFGAERLSPWAFAESCGT